MKTIALGVIKLIVLCVFGFAVGVVEASSRDISNRIHFEAIAAILILFAVSLLVIRAKPNESLGLQLGLYILQVLSLWSGHYAGLATFYHPEDRHLLDSAIVGAATLWFVSASIGAIVTVVLYRRRKHGGQS